MWKVHTRAHTQVAKWVVPCQQGTTCNACAGFRPMLKVGVGWEGGKRGNGPTLAPTNSWGGGGQSTTFGLQCSLEHFLQKFR